MDYLLFIRHIVAELLVGDEPPYTIIVEAPLGIFASILEQLYLDTLDLTTLEELPDGSVVQTSEFVEGSITFRESDHFHIFKVTP